MPEPSTTDSEDQPKESDSATKPAAKKRSWLKILFIVVGVILLTVVSVIAFLIFRPTAFDISRFSETIDQQITEALGREISIDGSIVLVTGLVPSVRLEMLTVDNPDDWESDEKFATLESFETSIGLNELLNQKINIDDIKVIGLTAWLERNAAGQGNWEGFAAIDDDDAGTDSDSDDEPGEGIDLSFTELGGIDIADLHVSYWEPEMPEPYHFELDSLQGSAKLGQAMLLSLSGSFLDLPLSGDFKGGTLTALRSRSSEWPVELAAQLGDTAVRIDGNLSTVNFEAPGLMNFDLDVPKPQQLIPLIGELPDFGSLQLSGQAVRSATDSYSVADLHGRLGSAEVTGQVDIDMSGEIAQIDGSVKAGSINLVEFRPEDEGEDTDSDNSAVDAAPSSATADASPSGAGIADSDTPLFAKKVLPFIGRLKIDVDELVGAVAGMKVHSLGLELQVVENGGTAELEVMAGDVPLRGRLTLTRLSERGVKLDLKLDSVDADFTEILAFYTGTDRFQGSVKRLAYHIKGAAETLRDAWLERYVTLEINEAEMVFQGEDEAFHFDLEHGLFEGKSGEPGGGVISGSIRDAPFELTLGFDSADPETVSLARLLSLDGKIADVELSIQNQLEERPDLGDAHFVFSVKGGSLDQLDSIYELNLPPLGPYNASGVFFREGKLLEFRDITMKIGSTQLSGSYRHESRPDRPLVTLELKSPSLQLGDFLFSQWSPVGTGSSEKSDGEGTEGNDILSYEALNEFDGTIKLDFEQVLSGKDRLGHGSLTARIEAGRMVIAPLNLGIPGGSFKGEFSFQPKANRKLDWNLQLSAQGFEIGVLARRADPDSDFSAIANADLNIGARGAPYAAPRLRDSSGSFDIDVCPRNVKAGGLDIWVSNLLLALLPKFDPKNESVVNCLIGRFRLENGVMVPTTLGMDTTKLRVIAEGQIDLAAEKYDLKLTPLSKRPRLFNLEIPVGVTGSLTEPEITMGKLPILRSASRITTNTLLFPVKFIFGDRLPEDGSDVCPCAGGQ